MSAKFDAFPSLPFQDIKEKPKRHGRMDGRMERRTIGQRENSIPPANIVCGGGGYNKNLGIFYILHDNFYLDSNGVSLPKYMVVLIIYIIILSLSLNYFCLFSFIFLAMKNINERKYKGKN